LIGPEIGAGSTASDAPAATAQSPAAIYEQQWVGFHER
jgi:hypothetical protein